MTSTADVLGQRVLNQWLLGSTAASGAEVVRWMGAVQAQDYGAAKWALAQRAPSLTSASIDAELAAGRILRTHILRPTWHFVVPEDIRWMLALSAARTRKAARMGLRQSAISSAVLADATGVIVEALSGQGRLTRAELRARVDQAGVHVADGVAFGRVLHAAEIDGLICSGGLRGKQHTYALLEEIVPPVPARSHDAALGELATRYFAGHGPATRDDFRWWSGLLAAEVRTAMETAEPRLDTVESEGQRYWRCGPPPNGPHNAPSRDRRVARLLPNFDEYTVGYAERSALVPGVGTVPADPFVILGNVLLVDGTIRGTWTRTASRTALVITARAFAAMTGSERAALHASAERYGDFLELQATMRWEVA